MSKREESSAQTQGPREGQGENVIQPGSAHPPSAWRAGRLGAQLPRQEQRQKSADCEFDRQEPRPIGRCGGQLPRSLESFGVLAR
jgi:hypothetical protein